MANLTLEDEENSFNPQGHSRAMAEKAMYELDKKKNHLRERLWAAVEMGDSEAVFLVIRHVERDDNIESMAEIIEPMTPDGVTPVYIACKNGNVECAKLLMDAGAAASRTTKKGRLTPLFSACQAGKPKAVELLLQQKDVRIELRTSDGRTALYAAAEGGDASCVSQLLERGAKIDTRRDDKSTPLIVAAYYGHDEVVEMLLAAGALLKPKDEDGTALTNARRQAASVGGTEKHARCVELLEKAWKERGSMEAIAAEDEDEPADLD